MAAVQRAELAGTGALMKQKIIFDGRNLYVPEEMEQWGFEYYCIGRNRRPLVKPINQPQREPSLRLG